MTTKLEGNRSDGYVRKRQLLDISYGLSYYHDSLKHEGWLYCQCPVATALRQLEELFITRQGKRGRGVVHQ